LGFGPIGEILQLGVGKPARTLDEASIIEFT